MPQTIIVKFVPVISNAVPAMNNPILIASVVTFTGVLLTVVISTVANFRLSKKRNQFEQELAKAKIDSDHRIAVQALEDQAQARRQSQREIARLKQIDFQRSTLIELQEILHKLYLKYSSYALSDAEERNVIDDDITPLNARTLILISRVHDDIMRNSAQDLKGSLIKLGQQADEGKVEWDDFHASLKLFNNYVEKSGRMIRTLDELEVHVDVVTNVSP